MKGFIIKTEKGQSIRFGYYSDAAPVTVAAFARHLPFSQTFIHASLSGQEFWTDKAPSLDIVQENSSVFTQPGEVVIGPSTPARVKTCNCMGIYYGEGKGLDACNIFATVWKEDVTLLKELGEQIRRHGEQTIYFEALD